MVKGSYLSLLVTLIFPQAYGKKMNALKMQL